MFINIKYYVITIASIFLALGIGIYIGFMLNGQDVFVQQQDTLINELEKKFNDLTQNNNTLKQQSKESETKLSNYETYAEATFPKIINNSLKGKNVAIVETNGDYIYTSVRSAIADAGGSITSTTTIYPDVLENDPTKLKEIVDYFAIKGTIIKPVTTGNVYNFIVKKISDSLSKNADIDALGFLKREGVIDYVGDYISTVDSAVVCGGSLQKSDDPSMIDMPLINFLKKAGIHVIGAERSDVTYSYIDYYKKMKLSTVDDVDTTFGKTAIIYEIKGVNGNYGIKKTAASGLIPTIN